MAHRSGNENWQPVALGFALSGRLFLGLVKLPVLAGVLWLAGALFVAPFANLGASILLVALVAMVVTEVLSTLVERLFVLRHQHDDPGDPIQAVLVTLVPLAGGAVGGWVGAPGESVMIASALTTLIVYLPFVLLLDRPWVQGPGRTEVKQAWKDTKTMTKETFRS